MIIKTTAVYFDGESSAPQNIELFLDKKRAVFYFETSKAGWINWDIGRLDFIYKSDALKLQLKENPAENINIKDAHFIAGLKMFLHENGNVGWYQKLINLGFKAHSVLAFALLLSIGLSYFYALPWIAEKSVALVPETYDTDLGNLVFEQSMMTSKVDSSKTEKLNQFAQQLRLNNTKKLHFTVVDSEIINAYALPNGNIVVFTGIIDKMESYEELAGLIGHEAAHINHRHSMKSLCRDLSGYLFVSAILGDVNGVMAVIGENANNLQSLSFSRDFEHQADLEGYKILVANKINPKGMSDLFSRLQENESFSLPEFLSSHPVTKERISFIRSLLKSEKYQTIENTHLKSLFQSIKG
jgi:beta-barrel assembly-enhancing protease